MLRIVWTRRDALRPVLLVWPVVLVALPFVLGVGGRATELSGQGSPTRQIAIVQGNVPEPGLEFNARRRAVTDMHAAETHQLAEAVRVGRFTAVQAEDVRRQGLDAIAALEARAWPFDRDWSTWRPDPSWSAPALPEDSAAYADVVA